MAGERILIVEDEMLFAKELQTKLGRLGYIIAGVAATGEDALHLAEEQHPDLVLMDVHLAGVSMDGIEIAHQISALFAIPIIYLTAYTDTETIERVKATLSFGYLLKPLREQALEITIEMAIYKHNVEKALQETNQRLKKEITERKIAEEDLQMAKAVAESANQAKSEFLASISHELRTPLNAILGYTQVVLLDAGLSMKHYHALETIQHSGEHLLSMINEILDLAKIEEHRIELEPTEFHLPALLKDISEMIQIQAYHKGLTFLFETVSDLPIMVYGDEKRLRQVLINLLSNAVKFTETGTVTFRAVNSGSQASHDRAQISKIRFEVKDSGIGIPAEHLEKIFLPFEQVYNRHIISEGTSLGLAISRRLVQMMGGELQVSSISGQGSTFWCDLDLREVLVMNSPQTMKRQRIVGFQGETPHILLVDDNDENRLMLKDMLFPLGFEIVEAADGKEAVIRARQYSPVLIFMDIIMPRMDGLEATRQIRKLSPYSGKQYPVIVAVSASVFAQTKEESFAAGCNDFLTKPIDEDLLFEKLQTYLKLEWIYDERLLGRTAPQSAVKHRQSSIIPPPLEELTLLYNAAMIGDIMEIRKRIETMDWRIPELAPFADNMRLLAKTLNLNGIQQFLEQFLS